MQNPTLIATPFAENGDKNTIPESVGAEPQNATMQTGFPPITQEKISAGGIPPERNDFNGILNALSQHTVFLNKGGRYGFDAEFAAKIGGYEKGACLVLNDGTEVVSDIDGNILDPNIDMTGWSFPIFKTKASDILDESGLTQQEVNNNQVTKNTDYDLFKNNSAISVSNVQDMISINSLLISTNKTYLVGGTQGGEFKWVVGITTENGGTVFEHNTVKSGRFIRQYSGLVYAEWFGAVNFVKGGTQDSTLAFQKTADFVGVGGSWGFKGLHRITSNVFIPARQSFGGDTGLYSPWRHITSNPTNWTGVNTGTMQAGDAIFYDSLIGDALTLGEGARPHDFLIYGRGVTTLGVDVTIGLPLATWSGNTSSAFRYGKFIMPTNITVAYFKYAFSSRLSPVSQGGVDVSGNFYQKMFNTEVCSCYSVFQFLDAIPYNHKCYELKMSGTSKLFESSVELRNFIFFGGSLEGYIEESRLPNSSEISFIGTYFETFYTQLISSVFLLNNNCTISFTDCLIYLNNCNHFVRDYTASTTASRVISKGNKFRTGSSNTIARNYIFRISTSPAIYGSLSADAITKTSASDVVYLETGATVSNIKKDDPMISVI